MRATRRYDREKLRKAIYRNRSRNAHVEFCTAQDARVRKLRAIIRRAELAAELGCSQADLKAAIETAIAKRAEDERKFCERAASVAERMRREG